MKASKTFYRTAIAKRDFWEAAEFLKRLPQEENRTVRYALLTAAVIAYARPFSANEKSSKAKANPRIHINPTAVLNADQLRVHKSVVRLRNKLVAHAEYDACPVTLEDVSSNGFTLLGPYVEDNGRMYDLRDYLENIDSAIFFRIAELFGCHCMNELHRLKDEESPNHRLQATRLPGRQARA